MRVAEFRVDLTKVFAECVQVANKLLLVLLIYHQSPEMFKDLTESQRFLVLLGEISWMKLRVNQRCMLF